MADPIAFFLDQHIPSAVCAGLRRHGVDVTTAQDENRCGFSDDDQLAYATSSNRVVVTFDADFIALHKSGVQRSGICWCPQKKHGIGDLIRSLLLVHGVLDVDSMRNHVEFL